MAQPEKLVVTPATLKAAEANITWPITELQATLRELAGEAKLVVDLPRFFWDILGFWREAPHRAAGMAAGALDSGRRLRRSGRGGPTLSSTA